MGRPIENEHPSNKLVSSMEHKIRELEEEISGMREWARMLLSANPTLETTWISSLSQAKQLSKIILHQLTLLLHLQNQPSSIQMLPKNIHIPNYQYPPQPHAYASRPPYLTPHLQNPTLQAPLHETPSHQVPWYRVPLIPFQIPPYQMPPCQTPHLPYQQPTYLIHNVKIFTQPHTRKNLFNVEKKPVEIYSHLAESIDQLYVRH
ncbi:hypothetical protein KY284_020300 [Solanum tuberosum]|nr:hypothetical protein KY284_020300 [Solanum tuberosum]